LIRKYKATISKVYLDFNPSSIPFKSLFHSIYLKLLALNRYKPHSLREALQNEMNIKYLLIKDKRSNLQEEFDLLSFIFFPFTFIHL